MWSHATSIINVNRYDGKKAVEPKDFGKNMVQGVLCNGVYMEWHLIQKNQVFRLF